MSFNKTKTSPDLGWDVHMHLLSKGVETPGVGENTVFANRKERIADIEFHVQKIMECLGLDLTDDSLIETPTRVAKMFVNETMWGLDPEAFPKCTTVENKMQYDEMVVEKDITVHSLCEHHLVPILGTATVAYIPKDKVLGLSKLNRIVEYYSRRPQIQERLTEQVYYALQHILGTDDVAVVMKAEHLCVKTRGVEDTSSYTITSKLGGGFRSRPEVRAEFMALVNAPKL